MLKLAEMQRLLLDDIFRGGIATRDAVLPGRLSAQEALTVHRNSILGALANALRITYPTIERLTGVEFFDQMAASYARRHPPRGAVLSTFVWNFPHFLSTYLPAKRHPYLLDVAFFDRAIDESVHHVFNAPGLTVQIDHYSHIELAESLRCLNVRYAVDQIRDLVEAGEIEDLLHLNLSPQLQSYAIWRGESGAMVRPLNPEAAIFLNALLNGLCCGEALEHALRNREAIEALHFICNEVITASFAKIFIQRKEGDEHGPLPN